MRLVWLTPVTHHAKENKLKPAWKALIIDGKRLAGCWETDIVRVERESEDLWRAWVPLRQIGQSRYYEARPLAMGGTWRKIGCYIKRIGAYHAAERMFAGEFVWRSGWTEGDGEKIPAGMFEWSEAAQEIKDTQNGITLE